MNEVTQPARQNPLVSFKGDLDKLNTAGELALPDSVPFKNFKNAAVVAITDNPAILQCDKQSLFRAVRTLAMAGLVPDGREAALVPFKGKAQAMPMVAGLIKVARNSGKIASLWAETVHEGEAYTIKIVEGERVFDHDYDPLNRSGKIIGAYAVAKLTDGTVDMEPMSRDEIEKRRKASANQKGDQPTGIWAQWYAEMAKKTVIRALCKRLPMSSEDMERLMTEQEPLLKDVTPERHEPTGPNPVARQIMGGTADPAAPDDAESEAHWTDAFDTSSGFPGDDAFTEGVNAYQSGDTRAVCPYRGDDQAAASWLAGWDEAKKNEESAA